MLRYRTLVLMLVLWMLVVLSVVTLAQNTAPWETALYAAEENTIYIATAQGVKQAILLPSYQGNRFLPQEISPDYRLAAGLIEIPAATPDGYTEHLPAIANLRDNTCCLVLDLPMELSEEFFTQFSNFNADGSRIIASTNNFSFDANTGAGVGGGVMTVVDTTTGAAISQVTTEDYFAYLFTWESDGVRFLPAPLGGTEWFPEGRLSIWNPDTGVIQEETDEIALWRGDVLHQTGEIVDATYNTGFPAMETGMITPSNVIEYYAAGESPYPDAGMVRETGQVVFYNPQDLDLYVSWILDGNAFLTHNGLYQFTDSVTVVVRGGTQNTLSTPKQRFLAATPDGWLMLGENGTLYHYFQSGSGFNFPELAQFTAPAEPIYNRFVVPLRTPLLGTGVSTQVGFPTVTRAIPQPSPNAAVCPGALPSRLVVGEWGWVLPGDANNLRDQPTTKANKVGEIQGGTRFTVLEGPICADNYAWWRVQDGYNQMGWTAEGDSSEYWVEPIR